VCSVFFVLVCVLFLLKSNFVSSYFCTSVRTVGTQLQLIYTYTRQYTRQPRLLNCLTSIAIDFLNALPSSKLKLICSSNVL
jgi:hypothetical protein